MARNMDDLILLDSILRSSNKTTRGNHAIPEPGVSCAAPIDRNFSLEGITIGLPIDYWQGLNGNGGIDPLVSARPWFINHQSLHVAGAEYGCADTCMTIWLSCQSTS